jgi:hypothetical protein
MHRSTRGKVYIGGFEQASQHKSLKWSLQWIPELVSIDDAGLPGDDPTLEDYTCSEYRGPYEAETQFTIQEEYTPVPFPRSRASKSIVFKPLVVEEDQSWKPFCLDGLHSDHCLCSSGYWYLGWLPSGREDDQG